MNCLRLEPEVDLADIGLSQKNKIGFIPQRLS